jgi:hypothetical protein
MRSLSPSSPWFIGPWLLCSALLCGYISSLGSIVNFGGTANPYPLTLYPGALYGLLLVLWFSRLRSQRLLRALLFILCSMCAYYSAVWTALYFEIDHWVMALAGGLGALLLGLSGRILLLRLSAKDFGSLAALGAVGGLLFFLILSSENNPSGLSRVLRMAGCYLVWQAPVGVLLYNRYKSQSASACAPA